MRIVKAFLMAAGLMSSAAHAVDRPARPPAGKWVVNFGAAECIASRNYGTAEAPFFLVLKNPPMGDIVQVALLKPGKSGKYSQQLSASLTLDDRPPVGMSMILAGGQQTDNVLFSMSLARPLAQSLAASKKVRIQAGHRLDETLELTQVGPVLAKLDECSAMLREVWHVKPEDLTMVSSPSAQLPPKADLKQRMSTSTGGFLSAADYPDIALRGDLEGSVTMALLVDESGRVADCTVIATTGVAALEAQSCGIVKQRAKFTPALGLDGKPTKDSTVTRITWRLED